MNLLYISAFLICFFGCFVVYGRLLDLSPELVPYLAGAAGWLIVVIERRSLIKSELKKLKKQRKTK